MNKALALAFVVACSASILTGCGDSSPPSGDAALAADLDGSALPLVRAYYGVHHYDDGKIVAKWSLNVHLVPSSFDCAKPSRLGSALVHPTLDPSSKYLGELIPTTAPPPGTQQWFYVWGSATFDASESTLEDRGDVTGTVDADLGYLDLTTQAFDKKGQLRGSFTAKHCPALDVVKSNAGG